jgi:hypothetical protein
LTTAPVIGDLDHDGSEEVVVISPQGFFIGDSSDFTGPYPRTVPVAFHSPPSLADINQDGELEIVVAGHGAIYAFHHNGALVTEFPLRDEGWLGSDFTQATVLIADLTGSGSLNLLLHAPLGNLVAFDLNGNRLAGFPLSVGITDTRIPLLGQFDDDPAPELMMGSSSGTIYGWNLDTGAGAGAYAPWSIWGGNPARTNQAPPSPFLVQPTGGGLPSNWTYCWPNPSEGNQSFIRVSLTYSADIKVRIFDFAGELVDELRSHADPVTPVDITWQLNHVQSGVYFAKVQTDGGNRSDTKILKVAVIK